MTDIHVSLSNEPTLGDVDTKQNLIDLLKVISKESYDLITLTGDLCYRDPDIEIYKWIDEQLTKYLDQNKIRIIAGNHDDVSMLCSTFSNLKLTNEGELYFDFELNNQKLIFLDTSSGKISGDQLVWLDNQVRQSHYRHVLIFMHHPPFIAGVPYMDLNYSLQNIDEFEEVIRRYPDQTFNIFCGHYHVHRTVSKKHLNVHITPSGYFQIDASVKEFKVDHTRIGYRIIEILDGEELRTYVKYL